LKHYDVAVVGAGPTGATAARELALQGVSVVLIEKDKLPRHKVCGGGIVFRARTMLDFDISSIVRSECYSAQFSLAKNGLTFKTSRDNPIVSMVMRSEFDHFLVDKACEAGAEFLHAAVESADFNDDHVLLHTSSGPVRALFVIAADGVKSVMAKLAGWHRLERLAPALECELKVSAVDLERFSGSARFDFDMPSSGYGWVFPKGDHLGIGIGGFGPRDSKVDLKKELRAYLHVLKLDLPEDTKIHGYVIPIQPRQDGFVRKRVFLVGDAAGLADPMSAEGITAGLVSGRQAATALVESKLDEQRSKQIYEAELARTLLVEVAASRKLAKLFYSSHTVRNGLLKLKGQRLTEKMADVFMGDTNYRDHADAFLRKLKLR